MKQSTEDTKPKVFVLMPFDDQYKDIYEVGIKAACRDAGAYCERVDEQMFDGSILARIYNQIAKADVIVADMTEHNSNVFYETGYAHALNKRVILLTQNVSDIPFDLKHQPHIVYCGEGKIASLKSQLEPRISWYIENPERSLPTGDLLQFSVEGVLLENTPTIPFLGKHFSREPDGGYNLIADFSIAIHNVTSKVLNPEAFHLGFILPIGLAAQVGEYEELPFRSKTSLPDGRKIYNIRPLPTLFPEGWDTIQIRIWTESALPRPSAEMAIRVFTELGPKDYPFIFQGNEEDILSE
jgi:hypothetical protein